MSSARIVWLCLLSLWLTSSALAAPWPKLLPTASPGSRLEIIDMDTDAMGNVYALGEFQGAIGIGIPVVSAGARDIFVAKFDPSGQLMWLRGAGGTYDENAGAIAVNPAGQVFVSGDFLLAANFGSLNRQAFGSPSFVASLDTDGFWSWVTANPAEIAPLSGSGIALSPDGGAVYSAYAQNVGLGEGDITLVRYRQSDGVVDWELPVANNVGAPLIVAADTGAISMLVTIPLFGGAADVCGQAYGSLRSVLVQVQDPFPADPDGSPQCLVGTLQEISASFLPQALDASGPDVVHAAFNSTLNGIDVTRVLGTSAVAWSQTISTSGTFFFSDLPSGEAPGIDLTTDAQGDYYLSGSFRGDITVTPFGRGPQLFQADGAGSAFVAKLRRSDGEILWFNTVESSEASTGDRLVSNAVTIDPSGRLYLGGALDGTAAFADRPDANPETSITSTQARAPGGALYFSSGFDSFAANYSGDPIPPAGQGSLEFSLQGAGNVDMYVRDDQGGANSELRVFAFRSDDSTAGFDIQAKALGGQTFNWVFFYPHERADAVAHDYAVVFDASAGTVTVYYDGEVLDTNNTLDPASLFEFRSLSTGAGPFPVGTAGPVLASLSLYRGTARTQGNIQLDLYREGLSNVGFNIAHYRFDETSGTTLLNSRLPAVFGGDATLAGANVVRTQITRGPRSGFSDGYIARLDSTGGPWFESEIWTIGQPVPAPEGWDGQSQPTPVVQGLTDDEARAYFVWNAFESNYYPVAPVVATLFWPTDSDPLSGMPPIDREGSADFPAVIPQFHVNGAPVSLDSVADPPSGPLAEPRTYVGVPFPFGGNQLVDSGRVFSRNLAPGDNPYTVIHYVKGPQADPALYASEFQVVLTQTWNTVGFVEDASGADACRVGRRITDSRHQQAASENGWVINPLSHYDGSGAFAAHDRATRSGAIIAANEDGPGSGDDMAVAWYTPDALGVLWPDVPVRYDCQWPTIAEGLEEIVIASTIGTGPISPGVFPSRRLYNQPDPALPGYNPNEEHARFFGDTAYALRNDLNVLAGASKPYVLVKYISAVDGEWLMRVFNVVASNATYPFGPRVADPDPFGLDVGLLIQAPTPINQTPGCEDRTLVSPAPITGSDVSAVWASEDGNLYARRATTRPNAVLLRYFYPFPDLPPNESFFYDFDGQPGPDVQPGECIPWLSHLDGQGDVPVAATYAFSWPAGIPQLSVGETLTVAKAGLPSISSQASVEIIYDEVAEADPADDPKLSAVRLYDPISERRVPLSAMSAGIDLAPLPFVLRSRLRIDADNLQLVFGGTLEIRPAGEPLLLPNVMTNRDATEICTVVDCAAHPEFVVALDELRKRTRNPNCIDVDTGGQGPASDAYLVGLSDGNRSCHELDFPAEVPLGFVSTADGVAEFEKFAGVPIALTAGAAADAGYVTLAFNNSPGGAVELAPLRVDCPLYSGEVIVLESDNLFEETLTLRHSGDFAGLADDLTFQWRFEGDSTGAPPTNDPDPLKAARFRDFETDFLPFNMTPASGQGAIDVTLRGPGVIALRDNWFVTRYVGPKKEDGSPVCVMPPGDYSEFSGTPDGMFTQAQLAQGWIKRVVGRLNLFDARVRDFHSSETNTIANAITQSGQRYEGAIALNPDPANLNAVGLIEAYETLLRRGMGFSINAGIRDAGANTQLLFAASRIADLYTLLGNEALSDASDPTIGVSTDGVLGNQASSIFAFQDQLATPLDEELALLRGRDGSLASVSTPPFYNKLIWNFTNGDGEVAYVSTYRMTDQNVDGFIDESEGRFFYPQGHGDAWGHYLTSMTTRYRLLRHPNYDWSPRIESVLVAGQPIPVDFGDERKFARAAAAKARAGADVVDLTYRREYVEDPAGQWQGYKDTSAQRAWGLSGWARRAGQGAYFDWLVGNSILPDVDPNPAHTGIQKVDRTTVGELREIAAQYRVIETQLDEADRGLNPLGLAKGVVPFDIDPNFLQIGSVVQGKTHFEQVAERAVAALQNAVTLFDYANQQSQGLREVQDDVDALADLTVEQELDFKHRLIELYGTPYSGDIGAGKAYPSGYTGPDFHKYMYVSTELTGRVFVPGDTISVQFEPFLTFDGASASGCYFPMDLPTTVAAGGCGGTPGNPSVSVDFEISPGTDWAFIATPSMGSRAAPGEIQMAISDLLQAQVALEQASLDHLAVIGQIEDLADLAAARFGPGVRNALSILNQQKMDTESLNAGIIVARGVAATARIVSTGIRNFSEVSQASLTLALIPPAAVAVATIGAAAEVGALVGDGVSEAAEVTAASLADVRDVVALQASIDIEGFGSEIEQQQLRAELAQLVREEATQRLAVVQQAEVVRQLAQRYAQRLAEASRILEERLVFRTLSAGSTQASRYRDMTFRIFRNDALQKYRAQRDLAARYVYLAASAYDYETNLLAGDSGSGRDFLADIVRERSLGTLVNGVPIPGTPGLADVLGRLQQNFAVLEGQLGFNNPQIETNRFSLRRELLRIRDTSDGAWRDALENYRVDDLFQIAEFRRFARPFAAEVLGPQPGLVIPFSTTVDFGLNFFGQQLAGGDSFYDPTNFATKIRSAGVWFSDYDAAGLANTPRIYMLPVGADVMRSPTLGTLESPRFWRIVDQRIPEPFPIGASSLNDPNWIPQNDSLLGNFADIRRFSSFRAYHDAGSFDPAQVTTDTRLIGRSVWNTQWLLIVPGGTLLFDANEGLDTFIEGPEVFPGAGVRTGAGISDIRLFFETYGYSGG